MTDDEKRLHEIRERASKATPGPWRYDSYNSIVEVGKRDKAKIIATILDHPQDDGPFTSEQAEERGAWYRESTRNADFIANSRADVEWLVSLVGRLMEQRKAAVEALGPPYKVGGNPNPIALTTTYALRIARALDILSSDTTEGEAT
jgi:hypothetical protein